MSDPNCQKTEKIAQGFTITEKVLMNVGVLATVIAGVYGISLQSIPWAIGYVGFVLFAMLVLIGYGNCSHCPYIYEEYTDCLFPPWGKVYRKLYKYRPGKLTLLDKILFFAFFIGIPLFPQYWLLKNYTVLIVFWLFCLPTAAGFFFYECRRCQHFGCPFNMAQKEV